MTDADLIYNALLRAERRLEPPAGTHPLTPDLQAQIAAYRAIKAIREEIGNGLSREGR